MSRFELDDELDLEMDERLRRFAQSSRTPRLPDETADLPWKVQLEPEPSGPFGFLFRARPHLRGAAMGAGRLAMTVAVAGAFLLLVSHVRPMATDNSYIIGAQPTQTALPSGAPAPVTGAGEVVLVPTSGVVDDVMADHVSGAIHRAESDGAAAVVIKLDTLGGAMDAMLRIDSALHSRIPTIVWVGPSGAKAASAGTFITLSANLAYMAESTNIGAASPVSQGGGDIASVYGQTEADKVMQDAMATMRGIAQERHPQAVDWAVSTVEKARSYSAQEALQAHGINGIAGDLNSVLSQADGQTVTTTAGSVVVHTKGASVVTIDEDLIQSVLHTLDDPNIAFILLVLGVGCVALEFFHPTILIGLIGAFSLALSFYGSGSLPLNLLGVVLVVLGVVLFMVEPAIPSHGLVALAGLISFVVGAVAFYGSPGPYLPGVSVAWPIILATTAGAALYGLVMIRTLLQMRRLPVPAGSGMVGTVQVIGEIGEVRRDLSPIGTVYVAGESWSAQASDGEAIVRGDRVKILRQDGLTLIVQKVE